MVFKYNFKEIEEKWQNEWENKNIFKVVEDKNKEKFYILEMFPYPSASGLHIGHAFNYIIGDIYTRYKIMQGFNVLHPMGYDSLGLPAENAAIKEGVHPKDYTEKAIANFISQQKKLGLSYDWSRMFMTHDPRYYKWDQWIFLKMYEKGIAFRKKAPVNWCPKCETVLANEQVHNGKCWRHKDTEVEIKQLEQWFFKITEYAEKLYDDIDKLKDWPEDVKAMQKNWIGKSYGTEIFFEINNKKWKVFTTRPDTIYGVTFMVISAQHPNLMELVTEEQKDKVLEFISKIKYTREEDIEKLEKKGVFTGSYATNPLTKEKIPVYVGNFVVAEYGSGMIMAVPAHDQRDFEFAKKYNLPIKVVIQPQDSELNNYEMEEAYTGDGLLVNSDQFNGMDNKEAIKAITKYLEEKGLGKRTIQFRLKDWLISRQRYWGTPIPIIYCDKCGIVPVPENELPVILPYNVIFDKGNPLATNKEFINVKCPKCNGNARRETDTMDTFVNSSWYFLRYCDPFNEKQIFDRERVDYWTPIDVYIGGKEHACMHLIYFRFYTKFLKELGLVNIDEPVIKLFNQGMVHGEDGAVMSKSRGNVVLPEEVSEKYGIDTARLFLVSNASPTKDIRWSESGIAGSLRFIKKILTYFDNVKVGKSTAKVESKLNKAIVKISRDIEEFNYNLAIIKLRNLFEYFGKEESIHTLETFLKLLHPFCPHITEELWRRLGNKSFIIQEKWPIADESKISPEIEKQERNIERLYEDITNIKRILGKGKKAYIYVLPDEITIYKEAKKELEKKTMLEIHIYAVNDKNKYDPHNKASKSKPGKPAVYIE